MAKAKSGNGDGVVKGQPVLHQDKTFTLNLGAVTFGAKSLSKSGESTTCYPIEALDGRTIACGIVNGKEARLSMRVNLMKPKVKVGDAMHNPDLV